MSCVHSFFDTNYSTSVCYSCGLEKLTALTPQEGYTTNVPLTNGYSRHHRMSMLLKQLFDPRHYGSPNSEVIAHTLRHGPFQHGTKLLQWLSKLKVKHKQYQNSHYYFAIASPTYVIPPPPCAAKVHSIEREFAKLEQRFTERSHDYKSFFSYNWLLRKFLQVEKLPFYLQFVKSIKCKKRMKMYETMWDVFKKDAPPPANSAAIGSDAFRNSQIQPVVLPANDSQRHPALQWTLNLLLRNYQSNSAAAT